MLRLPVAEEAVASEQATSLQRLRAGGVSGMTSVVSSMARISRLISHEIGAFFAVARFAERPHLKVDISQVVKSLPGQIQIVCAKRLRICR